jgi:ATP-dependent Clp protease protease subunit
MLNSDRYFRLLRDNAKPGGGEGFKAETNGDEATLYLYDVIASGKMEAEWWGGVAPELFVKELNALDVKTIHLRINSPGGSVFGARAMESAIRAHKAKIIAHVDGYAASAASFLAVACDEVEMAKGAFMMIHKAWSCMCGNSDDFLSAAELLDKIDGTLAETYAAKCGLTTDEIMEMLEAETWLTGQEAVDLGLADRLMDEEAKASAWDMSAYENAPKVEQVDDDLCDHPEGKAEPTDEPAEDNRDKYERLSRLHNITQPGSRAA